MTRQSEETSTTPMSLTDALAVIAAYENVRWTKDPTVREREALYQTARAVVWERAEEIRRERDGSKPQTV